MSSHGLVGKHVMFEQSAKVPYLVRLPEQAPPLRCSQPISHIDFVPTILDLMGRPPHPQCSGQSRANLIRGENPSPDLVFAQWSPTKHDYVVAQSKLANAEEIARCLHESTRAVISPDGWKLCLRDKDKNELYNLGEDPDERHNLYYIRMQSTAIEELTEQIHRWQERAADTVRV
jgi:arylsulfatase A-like enzyme